MIEFSFDESKIDNIEVFPISYWINREFDEAHRQIIIDKVGSWSFFKAHEEQGLNYHDFLEFMVESFKSKNDEAIKNQIIERFKVIAPTEFSCDPEIFATDSMYRAWFHNRSYFHSVLKKACEAKRDNPNKDRYFVLWDAIVDSRTPSICTDLNGVIFSSVDSEFNNIVLDHWNKVNYGCRCTLRALRKIDIERYIDRGQYSLDKNIESLFK